MRKWIRGEKGRQRWHSLFLAGIDYAETELRLPAIPSILPRQSTDPPGQVSQPSWPPLPLSL